MSEPLSNNLAGPKIPSDDENSVEEVTVKKYKPKLILKAKPDVKLTKESIGFRSDSPPQRDQEGLYDPDEDLEVQWHTDGIKNPRKRKLFIRELPQDLYQWRRCEHHQKLRELEEYFLDGIQNVISGFSDPFENLRKEYQDTRWNRIKNISTEGDERIQRIETLCRGVAQVFKEEGCVVLRKSDFTEPKKEIYEKAFFTKSPGRK